MSAFFPATSDYTITPGDVLAQLLAAYPKAGLLTTGEKMPGRWVLVTVCHADGSPCDWLKDPDNRGPSPEGSVLPRCCHDQDCIFQPGLSGEPRIKIKVA